MGDLSGKVAIITGAGRGLGREEALQLASQGASVVNLDSLIGTTVVTVTATRGQLLMKLRNFR